MLKIYHNPRCKKSRTGLAYLEKKIEEFELIKYLDDPFTVTSFKNILKKAGKSPQQMLRTQEDYYKKNLKGKDLSEDELIKEMVDNPKLIARPIVETDNKAILADPAEEIDKII